MTATVPCNEPPEARAGLTWEWTRSFPDFPASTWTLKYWFKKTGSSGANFSITATASGDGYAVNVPASTTAGYTAGDYTWSAQVTSGSDAKEVDRGTMKLLARYDQAQNLDDRSHARKMLAAIEALLESRGTVDQQEYTIGDRQLKRMSVDELRSWRDYYRGEVGAEEMGERLRNGQGGNRLLVRF